MKKILVLSFVFNSLIINFSFAQFFRLGGNPDGPGANGLLTNLNFFGATSTASIRLGTGGISCIFIGGTSYANPGFIGIGTNYQLPNNLLDVNGGDIDVNTPTRGYMIGNKVLINIFNC